jgi:hypothetical protein
MLDRKTINAIVSLVRKHADQPEISGFTIGYSSGPPEMRVQGQDHQVAARSGVKVLAAGLTRTEALNCEELVTAQLVQHPKYDKAGVRYVASAGGGPRVPPDRQVHFVYLAYATVSERARSVRQTRTDFAVIRQHGAPTAPVIEYRSDAEFHRAREVGVGYVVGIGKARAHLHDGQCHHAWQGGNLTTNGRRKAGSDSLAAAYNWLVINCPRRLADQAGWHICRCLRPLLGKLTA